MSLHPYTAPFPLPAPGPASVMEGPCSCPTSWTKGKVIWVHLPQCRKYGPLRRRLPAGVRNVITELVATNHHLSSKDWWCTWTTLGLMLMRAKYRNRGVITSMINFRVQVAAMHAAADWYVFLGIRCAALFRAEKLYQQFRPDFDRFGALDEHSVVTADGRRYASAAEALSFMSPKEQPTRTSDGRELVQSIVDMIGPYNLGALSAAALNDQELAAIVRTAMLDDFRLSHEPVAGKEEADRRMRMAKIMEDQADEKLARAAETDGKWPKDLDVEEQLDRAMRELREPLITPPGGQFNEEVGKKG